MAMSYLCMKKDTLKELSCLLYDQDYVFVIVHTFKSHINKMKRFKEQ